MFDFDFPNHSMATPYAYLCFHALNSGTKRKFSSKKFVSQFWTFFGFIWYVIYISVTFSYFYVWWWFEASNIKTFCLRKFDFLQHWLQSSKYHVIKEVKDNLSISTISYLNDNCMIKLLFINKIVIQISI